MQLAGVHVHAVGMMHHSSLVLEPFSPETAAGFLLHAGIVSLSSASSVET